MTAKIVNKNPQKFKDDVVEKVGKEVHISVEFPGDVTTSNATSTAGPIAKWVVRDTGFHQPVGRDPPGDVQKRRRSGRARGRSSRRRAVSDDGKGTPTSGRTA